MELINALGWTLASFVFVLGIMIFVHELGHHLMAKFMAIRVDVFSLGFGPRLFGFRRGETDYRVSALPLGGYVKMRGEHYEDSLTGSPDEFLSRPRLHRFAVAVAGPVMNIALAIVLLAGSYVVGVQVPKYLSDPPQVGSVIEGSPAANASLLRGDLIRMVDSTATENWEQLQLTVATRPGQTVTLSVERDGRVFDRIVTLGEDKTSGTGFLGVLPPSMTVVSQVEDGPAAEAGLAPGDIILAVESGGKRADQHGEILELIGASQAKPVDFTIRRGDEVFHRLITPVEIEGRVRVGIVIGPVPGLETRTERFGVIESIQRSIERNYRLTILTFTIVGKLITGATSLKMMSGPIEIARFSGQAAAQGPLALIGFMSLISLQLGIFNLLPIPILDGGVIALLMIEGLIGRDLSMRVKERIFQVGFIFLILLMSFVIFNDITKII